MEATASVLAALEAGRSRMVGLGRADDRWFTFNAGMGWDADVVADVERARAKGLEASPGRYGPQPRCVITCASTASRRP